MAQNIYDDPHFHAGYSQLPRSIAGLDAMPEWPAMRALLPPLAGQRVVDLGCGFGWFCRWAQEEGACEVLGFDLSARMLARAREMTVGTTVSYAQADLETLTLPEAVFDLAYSALALHYLRDLDRMFEMIHRALLPRGRLVFSIEHPIYMASRKAGWIETADGRRVWPVDSYQMEGERITDWLAPGVVKIHRTLGTLLNALIAAGFTIRHVQDWGPTDAQLAAQPSLAEERERPTFLLVAATR
ncbi:MAG TPA: class I SAM-dependent methyltransferase [Dongiaceae bacterium]|nr:class I SAM-dependent methyltransferase [Dongiaceae bacterium]